MFSFLDSYFPRAKVYRAFLAAPNRIYESSPRFSAFPYQERHLQCLWADARFRPKKLFSSEGEPIEVEYSGDWNLEEGPDFLRAILRVGRERRRICGDLEIHIRPSDWKQHGHTNHPSYKEVRFHVVYFQGAEIPGLLQIPLQRVLAEEPSFSFKNLDLSAYPYGIAEGNFPLKECTPEQQTYLLECAGEERLRRKAERLAMALREKEADQLLWEELLGALGYKRNKITFRHLAALLPLVRLRGMAQNPDEAYALLLGVSGLLPAQISIDWPEETQKFIRRCWDFWWKESGELQEIAMKKSDWKLSGLRPQNHPLRRLMAAAYYAFRIPSLLNDPQQLQTFPTTFWTTHLNWKRECPPTALVGKWRANAIITNLLIPFMAATEQKPVDLKSLPPEASNQIIRQAAYTLFGPDHTPKIYASALARQGLIQIFFDDLVPHRTNDLARILRQRFSDGLSLDGKEGQE